MPGLPFELRSTETSSRSLQLVLTGADIATKSFLVTPCRFMFLEVANGFLGDLSSAT